MKLLFLIVAVISLGVILTGCSVQEYQGVARYPDNNYQRPFSHNYESAPLSRHDQRWNPELATW